MCTSEGPECLRGVCGNPYVASIVEANGRGVIAKRLTS